MAIKAEPVTTRLLRLYCDKCGKELRHSQLLLSSPPKYKYECTCGNVELLTTGYPSVRYVDKDGLEVK